MHEIINNIINNEEHYRFHYKCYTVEDALFAIWHALTFHGVTNFLKCKHCGRYYLSKSKKIEYCNRNSLIERYNHLNCSQAVNNSKNNIRRRHLSTYKQLYNVYRGALNEHMVEYDDIVDKYNGDKTSMNYIIEMEALLDKKRIRDTWYKEEYKFDMNEK